MSTSTDLIRATAKVHKAEDALLDATDHRDRLIAKRHAEGASLRTIAEEAGVSHQQVKRIVQRA